jgi:FAD/FMN-containing dehydrogenase
MSSTPTTRPAPPLPQQPARHRVPPLDQDLFAPLRDQLRGRLVVRADGWWDAARAAWNLAVDQQPSAVVEAQDAADVAATVAFAREHGLRVAPQGTGHNAAPLGDLRGTVLLKTHRMRGITIDPDARTARVEAGVLWQELVDAAAEHGLCGLLGSSPDVGVVGYTLGGGLSWFGRKHGLSCSAVLSAEVVTADGVQRRVDAENDPELFWALRGGGGSFAVVTALELRLLPVGEVHAGALFWPAERGEDVWLSWREWVDTLPEDMTTWARFLQFPPLPEVPEPLRGGSFVVVEVCHLGSRAEADALLAEMRRLAPAMDTVATIPTTALTHVHMDPEHPVPGRGEGMLLAELPEEAVRRLVQVGGAGSGSPLLSLEVRHLGGALGRASTGALPSLPGRFAVFAVGMAVDAGAARAIDERCDAVLDALAPWDAGYRYLNFSERSADPSAFFPPGTQARLRAVKAQYDPEDVLRANHPVRTAREDAR